MNFVQCHHESVPSGADDPNAARVHSTAAFEVGSLVASLALTRDAEVEYEALSELTGSADRKP
jgi:hypothetical protein